MLDFDAEEGKDFRRKMLEIEGYDEVRPGTDSGGKHMPVVWIRKGQRRNEGLVTGDKAVPYMGVHQIPSALELLGLQIRSVLLDVSDPLVVDRISPFAR